MDTRSQLLIQAGGRTATFQSPHRAVFGRRHTPTGPRAIGESHVPLSEDDGSMSREWFSVEEVRLNALVPGGPGPGPDDCVLLVHCRSRHNSVQVWDGGDPVRVRCGARYLVQGSALFAGDLVGGRIVGARIERIGVPAGVVPEPGAGHGITAPPPRLEVTPQTHNVLLARYHRYYRTPPGFDPQPVPWAEVAVRLRLLEPAAAADPAALRRAVKPAQDAVTAAKQRVDVLYPGWLPAGSETQKTFHDHLRTVLEMQGFFAVDRLAAFDRAFPGTSP